MRGGGEGLKKEKAEQGGSGNTNKKESGKRGDGGGGNRRSENGAKSAAPQARDWDLNGPVELSQLTEWGEKLHLPTEDTTLWRKIPGTDETWYPPNGDALVERGLKIRRKDGKVALFKLNAAQAEYSRRCGKLNIVLKARQLGITSYIAARYFVQTITRPGTLTMLVAHDRISAEEIFRIVHRFWDNLNDNCRKGPLKTSHSSARELVFPVLDSEFTVTSADENAGRGRTIQNLHCTEVSRWGHEAGEALASLRAAVVPGGEIVLESTANGAWGPFYQEWQQAPETGYVQHFFPWWIEGSYKSEASLSFAMTAEEAEVAAAHGLTVQQIAWRRQQKSALRGMAVQEFAEDAATCFKATGECVFELEFVERLLAEAGEPVEVEDNGREATWLRPAPGREYLIGVDPAGGGIEGDYSCAEVIDWATGAQCAELHGHFQLKELAQRVAKLGTLYNGATLAVERNNHGNGVLAHLENLNYSKIYRQGEQEGWWTSAKSKPWVVENMSAMLASSPETFRSVRLLNECRTFVRSVAGVPRAASGAHDDCVMAMGIALAVRAEGRRRLLAASQQAGASSLETMTSSNCQNRT